MGSNTLYNAGHELIFLSSSWKKDQESGEKDQVNTLLFSENGFGHVSRRRSPKPITAAVNGPAMGGGFEMVVNCDVVVAAEDAKFAFPEPLRGVVATARGKSMVFISFSRSFF